MENKANVFILSEDGTFLEEELIDGICGVIRKQYEIMNMPQMNHVMMKKAYETGKRVLNAHNNPKYLVEEIEDSEFEPIVVAYDENDEGIPAPKFMVGEREISALIEGLHDNPDVDAWETTLAVNKRIRAEE